MTALTTNSRQSGTSDKITRSRALKYLSAITLGLVAKDLLAAQPAEAAPGCCGGAPTCPVCYSYGCPGSRCDTWYSGCGGSGYGWSVCCGGQWNFCHDYYDRPTRKNCICIVYCGYNCPC